MRDGVLRLNCPRYQIRVQVDVPAGLTVRAAVGQGDLTMWGVGGDLELTVATGVIAGRDLTATTVRAANGGGEVNLHFSAAPAEVEATTSAGPVLLVLPASAYYVDADAGAEVTVAQDEAAASTIRASSDDGPVSVLAATGSEVI